ncbi:hypothetical protein JBL43_19535 [Aureibaculum sp. A20]|uniref:Nuclear transport factor 2 family protein n=1 Tax=Aureibaculum flavum TaxID=2795986 RepID=A0ABS0WWY7_9FLAO|nr:hypothetical protein [Aureibaculum flavum]MBJ2176452.1 hypothetical protein [Aureibaculum flavum]
MKYIIFLSAIVISIGASSINESSPQNSTDLKEEAKEFSLSIVKSYFAEDCNKVYEVMSDSLLIMDGDGILSKINIKDKLCSSVKQAIDNKSKTFKDYIKTYQIEILSASELESKFDKKLPEYFKISDSDFFFLGFELKKDQEDYEDFIWDDMFLFMVSKEKKGWVMKGISG